MKEAIIQININELPLVQDQIDEYYRQKKNLNLWDVRDTQISVHYEFDGLVYEDSGWNLIRQSTKNVRRPSEARY